MKGGISMVNKFIYKNQSTESILSVPITYAFRDAIDEYTGLERESIRGESTLTHSIPNEYGTQYSSTITFDILLFKEDASAFSIEEQRKINAWLTSPKLSDYIEFTPCNKEPITMRGKFIDVAWLPSMRGLTSCRITFENDSPYTWKHVTDSYTGNGTYTKIIYCDSDELEEFVYPTLVITEPDETAPVVIKNITDNSNTMTVNAFHQLPIKIDCGHCMVTDATTNGIVSYSDLGWTDVGNIYWLRLLPGENNLQITGNVEINFDYYCPHKVLGEFV